jgi:hypothetical protein
MLLFPLLLWTVSFQFTFQDPTCSVQLNLLLLSISEESVINSSQIPQQASHEFGRLTVEQGMDNLCHRSISQSSTWMPQVFWSLDYTLKLCGFESKTILFYGRVCRLLVYFCHWASSKKVDRLFGINPQSH